MAAWAHFNQDAFKWSNGKRGRAWPCKVAQRPIAPALYRRGSPSLWCVVRHPADCHYHHVIRQTKRGNRKPIRSTDNKRHHSGELHVIRRIVATVSYRMATLQPEQDSAPPARPLSSRTAISIHHSGESRVNRQIMQKMLMGTLCPTPVSTKIG